MPVSPPAADRTAEANRKDLAILRRARRVKVLKASVVAAVILLLIAFVVQNSEPADLRLLFWTVPVHLIWVVVVSILLGAVVGYLLGRPDKNIRLHGPSRRQEDEPAAG